jgi:hypothetical protein
MYLAQGQQLSMRFGLIDESCTPSVHLFSQKILKVIWICEKSDLMMTPTLLSSTHYVICAYKLLAPSVHRHACVLGLV